MKALPRSTSKVPRARRNFCTAAGSRMSSRAKDDPAPIPKPLCLLDSRAFCPAALSEAEDDAGRQLQHATPGPEVCIFVGPTGQGSASAPENALAARPAPTARLYDDERHASMQAKMEKRFPVLWKFRPILALVPWPESATTLIGVEATSNRIPTPPIAAWRSTSVINRATRVPRKARIAPPVEGVLPKRK
eukprot:CAMPEP_0117599664 /NCGR_PEP_ID=MMETSP0784-20121206/76072_1 /TAXON_ID=39447 /ORGANISM="" /LENGTH=190 /DNA_ID=CAMNT_0005402239 /DNA_START=96 /DNA_END=665 /DNA_ORIENTATION=+